jgi:hypothetical protein
VIILDSLKDLEQYTVVEDNLLHDNLPAYPNFLARAQRAYNTYRANFPSSDYRPYQPEYATLMCLRRYNIMGYGMGCAKTSITLLGVKVLYEDISKHRPGLVHIAVPSLLAAGRWVEELERMPYFKEHYAVITSEKDLKDCKKQILIYTHDFPKGKSTFYRGTTTPNRSRFLKKFFKPCYLIIDEGHGLKAKTERTQHLKVLRDAARRVLLISGTLSDGNLAQIHHTCKFVYTKRWPYPTAQSFSQVFGEKEKLKTNYLYGSNTNTSAPEKFLQRLDSNKLVAYYKLMRRFVHRVKITEPQVAAYLTIPTQEVTVHRLEATEEQRTKTTAYIKEHRTKLEAAAQSTNTRHTAEALQLIHPLIELANSPENLTNKAKEVLQITKQSKGKTIIFCSYVRSARIITNYLSSSYEPGEVIRLYANDPLENPNTLGSEERQRRISAFQYDKKVKVAVLSINLASEAIDLTKATDVILYCMPWSVTKLQQALARAVRPGNINKTVGIHYLLQQGLIDEHQVALAIEKVKGTKLLLDYEANDLIHQDQAQLTPSETIRRLLGS